MSYRVDDEVLEAIRQRPCQRHRNPIYEMWALVPTANQRFMGVPPAPSSPESTADSKGAWCRR
jgi:hypothetical protein